jgi:hypothetical protein
MGFFSDAEDEGLEPSSPKGGGFQAPAPNTHNALFIIYLCLLYIHINPS